MKDFALYKRCLRSHLILAGWGKRKPHGRASLGFLSLGFSHNDENYFKYNTFFFLQFYYFIEDNRSIYIINLLGREVIRAFKEGNSFPVAPPHNDKW